MFIIVSCIEVDWSRLAINLLSVMISFTIHRLITFLNYLLTLNEIIMVEGFHVLSKWRWVSVTFLAARNFAKVRFVVLVCSAMLKSITWVAVGFYATRKTASIWFFQRVRSKRKNESVKQSQTFNILLEHLKCILRFSALEKAFEHPV